MAVCANHPEIDETWEYHWKFCKELVSSHAEPTQKLASKAFFILQKIYQVQAYCIKLHLIIKLL